MSFEKYFWKYLNFQKIFFKVIDLTAVVDLLKALDLSGLHEEWPGFQRRNRSGTEEEILRPYQGSQYRLIANVIIRG